MKLAITGVGIVSPLGNEIQSVTQNLKALQVPVTDYRLPGHFADPFLNVTKAFHCNIDDLDLEGLIEPKSRRWMDPTVITSMVAVDQAVQMAWYQYGYKWHMCKCCTGIGFSKKIYDIRRL